jgi:hypothetical protein
VGGINAAGGLTLASKHSGAIFLIAAWLWLFSAGVILGISTRRIRPVLVTTGVLVLTGAIVLGLFIALSPALWNDPVAQIGDLARLRGELLDIQVSIDSEAPISQFERGVNLLTQPFATSSVMYFEMSNWKGIPDILAQIERYQASGAGGFAGKLACRDWLNSAAAVGYCDAHHLAF